MAEYATQYSIKDLEKLTGIKAHTIRMWEKRHGIVVPKRTATNIRYYDDAQLKHLLNVTVMLEAGKKISYIGSLTPEELHGEVKGVFEDEGEDYEHLKYSARTNGLMVAMFEVDEPKFLNIMSASIRDIGFRKTITDLVYPFLEKVGIMWGINEINPAQEHFISHLIRRKIEREIDELPVPVDSGKKTYLLFLPEDELHELGLLLSQYLLRSRGFKTYYLGQNVPYADMLKVSNQVDADVLLTFFIRALPAEEVGGFLKTLCKDHQTKEIFFSGPLKIFKDVELPKNAVLLNGLDHFEELLIEQSEIN